MWNIWEGFHSSFKPAQAYGHQYGEKTLNWTQIVIIVAPFHFHFSRIFIFPARNKFNLQSSGYSFWRHEFLGFLGCGELSFLSMECKEHLHLTASLCHFHHCHYQIHHHHPICQMNCCDEKERVRCSIYPKQISQLGIWDPKCWLRRGLVALITFVWLFSTVCFQMCSQIACLRRDKVTLVGFFYFSPLCIF